MSIPNDPNTNDAIEVTAATVDAAISQALEQLGAREDDVAITVLSTPRAGLLGLGARQARVRVTRRAPAAARSGVMSPPPAPPPRPRVAAPPKPAAPTQAVAPAARPAPPLPRETVPSRAAVESQESSAAPIARPAAKPAALPERPHERPMPAEEEERIEELSEQIQEDNRRSAETKGQVAEATALLTRVLELMGEQATVETVCDDDPEMLEVNIKGDGSGLLIGRHGQTLDALEYFVNRVIARRIKDAAPISIDSEAYRARRRGQLHRMALGTGEEVKREHRAVTLEPMPPRDRRIIHLALKDDPLLTTRSAGEGFLRAIQIVPVDERREGGGAGRGRDSRRGRGGPAEAPRDDPQPIGQQGGFRHGQKRIV
jgi:spoIIIJ-associated protein